MTQKEILDLYTDHLISTQQQVTATGLSQIVEGKISHDKITRFLNKSEYTSKDLWQYVKSTVRSCEKEKGGVLIIDDTIEEKPYTDENEIVGWYYSHAKERLVKGINILSCIIRYEDIALPIGFEIIKKDVHCYDQKTGKESKKSSKTKNQYFRKLVEQAVSNQIKFEYVLADSWFGSKDNMEFVHYQVQKKFIFGMKANRLAAPSAEDRKKGRYCSINDLGLKNGEKSLVWLKDLAFAVVLVKKVFINEDSSSGTLYLVTNDLDCNADPIYLVYQKRWRIEEYHKSIKQNTALEKSPTKVPASQKNHIFSSIIAYCKLEFLKLKTSLNHFALKYHILLKANQVAFHHLQLLRQQSMLT